MSTIKVRCIVPTTAQLHFDEVYEAVPWAGWYLLAKFGALLFPPHWFEVQGAAPGAVLISGESLAALRTRTEEAEVNLADAATIDSAGERVRVIRELERELATLREALSSARHALSCARDEWGSGAPFPVPVPDWPKLLKDLVEELQRAATPAIAHRRKAETDGVCVITYEHCAHRYLDSMLDALLAEPLRAAVAALATVEDWEKKP